MAILGDLECRVFCNGQPLYEHEDPDGALIQSNSTKGGNGPTVKKYIQSSPRENFSIKLEIGLPDLFQGFSVLDFETRIDGKLVDETLVFKQDVRNDRGLICYVEDVSRYSNNLWQLHKFRFQDLQLHENVTMKGKRQPARDSNIVISDFKVSEKGLKGLTKDCITTVDAASKSEEVGLYNTTRLPGPALATFDFRYLTIDGLKKAGIIQEPTEPDVFEMLRHMQLTDEEVEDLADIVHFARKDARKRIKQENQAVANSRDMTPRKRTEYNPDQLEEVEQPQKRMARTTPLVELD